jgi:hypothetical protein
MTVIDSWETFFKTVENMRTDMFTDGKKSNNKKAIITKLIHLTVDEWETETGEKMQDNGLVWVFTLDEKRGEAGEFCSNKPLPTQKGGN